VHTLPIQEALLRILKAWKLKVGGDGFGVQVAVGLGGRPGCPRNRSDPKPSTTTSGWP